MPRPLQAGQCSAPTLWLSDPWLGARVSDHGGDNETPQNQTNFQSPISPRFRNPPFFQSHSTWSRRILLPKGWNHDDQSTIQFIEAMTFLFEIVLIFHICPQITGATFILGWSCWLLQNSLFCESWPCLLLAWLIVWSVQSMGGVSQLPLNRLLRLSDTEMAAIVRLTTTQRKSLNCDNYHYSALLLYEGPSTNCSELLSEKVEIIWNVIGPSEVTVASRTQPLGLLCLWQCLKAEKGI